MTTFLSKNSERYNISFSSVSTNHIPKSLAKSKLVRKTLEYLFSFVNFFHSNVSQKLRLYEKYVL